MIRPLGVLSPSAPKALACADALGYRGLDPRPRPSPRFALFTRSADRRFSGSDCRPTTSATYFRRTVTLPSIRFSRFGAPRFRVGRLRICARFRHGPFWSLTTFPSRRRTTSTASRDSPSEAGPTALQERRKTRPRKPSPDRNAACGRRFGPTIVCGDGRWTIALDCTGRVTLSEGPSLTPPAAAERRG